MNFLNFEYVLAICRAGTLRGAADALFISPQALSENLSKLEKELGVSLFRRTKPLTLTAAGERFVACAETCLAARQTLEGELSVIRRQNDAQISLGVPAGMPPPLLLSFLTYFRHAHPELTVTVTELPTSTGALYDIPGHIDAVFGEFRGSSSRVEYRPVFRSSRFVVAIRRELLYASMDAAAAERAERCARTGEFMPLSDFRTCPFVLKRTGSIVRQNEDRMFRAASFIPSWSLETGDMELTIRMILLGEAAVFFPEPVARANLANPAYFESDRTILLCPVENGTEEWALSLGLDRFRRASAGVAILEEAAVLYYEKALGSPSP